MNVRKEDIKRQAQRGRPRWFWPLLGGAAVVIVAVLAAALLWPRSSAGGFEAQALPSRGDQSLLTGVQSFPSEGQQHVDQGTPVDYKTSPPTSGSHYPSPTQAGFYTETPPPGNLVHSLEHGAVVVYSNPQNLTDDVEQSLKGFANAHSDAWASVVVVPNPAPTPESAYILTAWTKMLILDSYNLQVVQAFLAEYLGRGPENRVR